jgi:hypothetical protein
MLHNKKISQRRVLLFDHIGGQGFQTMPSTESEPCRPPIPITPSLVDDMPSEQVADIRRNEWTACFGIAGRHGLDYAGIGAGCRDHGVEGLSSHLGGIA